MKEITEYIKAAGTFYLATENGDQPEVRPIGVLQEYDGKLYTAVGKHKNVYKQIVANEAGRRLGACTRNSSGCAAGNRGQGV